jgi:hypothetical protein
MPAPISVRTAAALAVLFAALAGCADAPPWVQSASADQIVLRWYPRDFDAGQAGAQARADMHCSQTGRRASLVATQLSGSVQLATYACQ